MRFKIMVQGQLKTPAAMTPKIPEKKQYSNKHENRMTSEKINETTF